MLYGRRCQVSWVGRFFLNPKPEPPNLTPSTLEQVSGPLGVFFAGAKSTAFSDRATATQREKALQLPTAVKPARNKSAIQGQILALA